MGFLFPEDKSYDESVRQEGFYRYRQLLSRHFGQWWKIHLLTLLGFLPLAVGIFFAIASSSILVLIPCGILGGMISGPFLSGLYDAILRGLRDDSGNAWKNYRRSWRQNWRCSLIPGACMGLMIGLYAFMAMLFWWAETPPSLGTVALYLFSCLLLLVIGMLYWPQMVLFDQTASLRLRNCMLFCIRYFWRVMGVGLLQLAYLLIYVLFAPWTLLLVPFLGLWYILFLSQLLIYHQLDEAFHIEERFYPKKETPSSEE